MHATVTSRLVDKLNKARGLSYPAIGYLMFADIKGDGISKPALFEIINAGGGVRRSDLNGPPRQRCAKLRAAIRGNCRTGKDATYRGVSIGRVEHNGVWTALMGGRYLKADTLTGLKKLIKENL